MKANNQVFTPMSPEQLMETNGGGFAFDVARIIRFIGIAFPSTPITMANAITDWQINAAEE